MIYGFYKSRKSPLKLLAGFVLQRILFFYSQCLQERQCIDLQKKAEDVMTCSRISLQKPRKTYVKKIVDRRYGQLSFTDK